MSPQTVLHPVSLQEANQNFSRLIREAELGKGFVVTRRGRPVARILPNDEARTRNPRWIAAFERMNARLREGAPLGGLKIEERDELHGREPFETK